MSANQDKQAFRFSVSEDNSLAQKSRVSPRDQIKHSLLPTPSHPYHVQKVLKVDELIASLSSSAQERNVGGLNWPSAE